MTPSERLLTVFRYWQHLADKLGSPELLLLSQINRQAVIDYLEEPGRTREDGHQYVSNGHRLSAYAWLFGMPRYYGNLEFLCYTFGPDVKIVRALIVESALCHERISLDDSGRTMLDPDPICGDHSDGGDVHGEDDF